MSIPGLWACLLIIATWITQQCSGQDSAQDPSAVFKDVLLSYSPEEACKGFTTRSDEAGLITVDHDALIPPPASWPWPPGTGKCLPATMLFPEPVAGLELFEGSAERSTIMSGSDGPSFAPGPTVEDPSNDRPCRTFR